MIIVLKPGAHQPDIDALMKRISGLGLAPHLSQGTERTLVLVIGDERKLDVVPLESFPGVDHVIPVLEPYKLASREFHAASTSFSLDGSGLTIGGQALTIMAGPCAVENEPQLLEIARRVKAAGATVLRGGAYKPRSSPYSFQGLGEAGLKMLAAARAETGLAVVTEVLDTRSVELVTRYADVLQVGARNMQNFELLKEVGRGSKPVLLKRGMMATIQEWLLSAEYILSQGNPRVILCERGIRTFETATRNTLDLTAVVVAKEATHLPVIVDPSQATGKWRWVSPMAKAGIVAGADGLIIEVHPRPQDAVSDGDQSLLPEKFDLLMQDLRRLAPIMNRSI